MGPEIDSRNIPSHLDRVSKEADSSMYNLA